MDRIIRHFKSINNCIPIKELIFQFISMLCVLAYLTLVKERSHFHLWDISFLLNYFIGVWIINYLLIPKLYYNKKYTAFVLGSIGVILLVVLIEELVLEQIFFPNSRGNDFFLAHGSFIEIGPLILLLIGGKFAWDAQQKQKEIQELNKVKAAAELNFLKSQINPHFLFNNLNNLYAYALEQSPKTPELILILSDLLRYMLYDCKEKYVPLSNEIENLSNYIRLQEMQIEDRGTISFKVNGVYADKLIAPQILFVFIENCFKHSTSSQSEGIRIQINIQIENNTLVMDCVNSYTEITNSNQIRSGIGLKNVRATLDLVYPSSYELKVQQKEKEYQVHLSLNL